MAKKATLRDKDNNIVYPQTIADQIMFDDGGSLDSELAKKGNTTTMLHSNVSVATSLWAKNTNTQAATAERSDYPFMATIPITSPSITASDIARVMFGYTEQTSGNFAPNCYTTTNGVIIEAKEKPTATITLDYILIERIL